MTIGKQWIEIETDFWNSVLNLNDRVGGSHQNLLFAIVKYKNTQSK